MTARDERHWGRAPHGAPPAQRYVNGRLVRSTGFVDEHGMFYPLPRSRAWPVIQAICIGVILAAAVVFVLPLLVAPPRVMTTQSPLGTADVRPRPTRPPDPPQSEPASVPLFADATPAPAYDNAAYNATAEAVQATVVVEQAPIIVVTATPGISTAFRDGAQHAEQAALKQFDESFQEPACPKGVITFLKGHPCYTGPPPQAILPQPGEDGFVESFEDSGE